MRANRIVLAAASAALALVMLFACLYWLPLVARRGTDTLTDAVAVQADAETDKRLPSAKDVTVPAAAAEYNFMASDFDATGWSARKAAGAAKTPEVIAGTGLSITGGYQQLENAADATSSYGRANPLKGALTDGFSVVLNGAVFGFVDDYCCLFGFTKVSGSVPAYSGNNFMFVASSGNGLHLNNIGTTGIESDFYDITPKSALNMSSSSQYILTVSKSEMTVYLNGEQKAKYISGTDYKCDTVDFVNNSDWFLFGRACDFWGTASMTVQSVSLYNSALTADEIAAMNADLADFTALNAAIAAAEEVDITNYNTKENGWEAAYEAFTGALDAAKGMAWNASQTDIDNAETALVNATAALSGFLRAADLTDSLVAAYPLSADGKNLVGTDKSEVLFMNGTQTSDNLKLAKRQAIVGAKLYADENLADREMLDTSPTPTTGLKIPADAFDGVSTSTGMTLTVSVYAYNFYRPYSRIFQLGTKASSGDGANGAQLYLMVTGGLQCGMGDTIYVNNAVVGTYIAGEWITVSLVFTPDGTFRAYMTSNTSDRITGGITSYEYANKANVDTVLNAIINGQDNWIGRSYWSADGNLVGLASNLSVYNRALSKAEVEQLHHTKDLSTLVAGA